MELAVAHLYPDYLNIYADRGNIAVLERRAAWRGIRVDYHAVSVGEPLYGTDTYSEFVSKLQRAVADLTAAEKLPLWE